MILAATSLDSFVQLITVLIIFVFMFFSPLLLFCDRYKLFKSHLLIDELS